MVLIYIYIYAVPKITFNSSLKFICDRYFVFLFLELERKISVRSTREELIRKGVLKEPLDIKPSTQDGPSIEQTSAEISNDQNKTSTVVVEQNHVDQNSKFLTHFRSDW